MKGEPGDTITIRSRHVGESEKTGTIVEVLGEDGAPPFRVRWEGDEGVHLFVPGSDAHVEPRG